MSLSWFYEIVLHVTESLDNVPIWFLIGQMDMHMGQN